MKAYVTRIFLFLDVLSLARAAYPRDSFADSDTRANEFLSSSSTRFITATQAHSQPIRSRSLAPSYLVRPGAIGLSKPAIIRPFDRPTSQQKQKFVALLDKVLGKDNYVYTDILGFTWATAESVTVAQGRTLRQSKDVVRRVVWDVESQDEELVEWHLDQARDISEVAAAAPTSQWTLQALADRRRSKRGVILKQANAPTSLVVLSQPPGTELGSRSNYEYDSTSGEGVTVYVLDTGFYKRSREYKMMAVKPRWMFAEGRKLLHWETDNNRLGHGTCVGSKITGPVFGAAKKASLVVVKKNLLFGDSITALAKILKDIDANSLRGKAVINWSGGFDESIGNGFLPSEETSVAEELFLELFKRDVVIVLPAGNHGPGPVTMYPQTLAGRPDMPFIIVGAVDESFQNASFSNSGSLVHVMAPGVAIRCASNSFFRHTNILSGTSFATPLVSGLIATLISEGKYPELHQTEGKTAYRIRDLIIDMAYSRAPGGSPVVFNGQGANCKKIMSTDPSRPYRYRCDPL